MKDIIISVLLSTLVGPGAGQIYNREFKKGWILIGFTLGLLVMFFIWRVRAAMPYFPADVSTLDYAMLQEIIKKYVVPNYSVTFYTYQILLGGLWVYGIVDAYIGAARRGPGKSTVEV